MLKFSPRTRDFLRKIKPPEAIWRLMALLGIQALNAWMATLNYRVFRYEEDSDPSDENFAGPVIFVFWHEYIPFPVYTRPHCRLAMLLSQHQDAEILSHIASFAGLSTVRGSTNRGGTNALRELLEKGRGLNLAITPDGPRGPRRRLAQGCIYVASRLQIPIVPVGFGYDRPWRNKRSWDKFAIPRPFSRARAVLGPRLWIPPDLDREGIENHRKWIEEQLEGMTRNAERWAEGKFSVEGDEILYRSTPRQRQTPGERGSNSIEADAAQSSSSEVQDSAGTPSSGLKIAG